MKSYTRFNEEKMTHEYIIEFDSEEERERAMQIFGEMKKQMKLAPVPSEMGKKQ